MKEARGNLAFLFLSQSAKKKKENFIKGLEIEY